MISILFVSPDKKTIMKPMVTKMVWETHRKGSAGVLELTILDQPDTLTTLGTYVNVFVDQERIMVYRIFERRLQHHFISIIAYDQLYHLIQSKESIRISMVNYAELEGMKSHWDHLSQQTNPVLLTREAFHQAYIQSGYRKKVFSEVTNGVFASDVILLFAKQYQLGLDYIDYSDAPEISTKNVDFYVDIDKYGFPSRVTNREKVLDIIQSYIDLTTILLKDIYMLYDGGNGLCYRRLMDMRTYLLFDLTNIGEYHFREYLPKEYANRVDFPVTAYQNQGTLVSMKNSKNGYFEDGDRIQQLGVFHDTQDITEQDLLTSNQEMIHAFGTKSDTINATYQQSIPDVMVNRILFYQAMNEVLPTTLSIKNAKGSWKVRGGSIIAIEIQTFDQKKIRMEVVVESVRHTYVSETDHHMDLEITNTFTQTSPFKTQTRNVKVKIPIGD